MNHSEERLAKAFRNLAAASPRSAAPETGAALKDAFRRHHARRRRAIRTRVVLLLLCVALPAGLLVMKRTPGPVPVNPSTHAPVAMAPPLVEAAPAAIDTAATAPSRAARNQSSEFMQLTSFDSTVSADDLLLVRVEMPVSALRLVGAPVHETTAERRVLADFLVGQDGTAYAVRLVR